MSYLRSFGTYVPDRVVPNTEVAAALGVEPEWIVQASGIEQRRWAATEQSVADLGTLAARNCLERGGIVPGEIGLILVSSGTAERRFPGPASAIGLALGIPGVPAIDLPLASAGSLFGLSLASQLAPTYGNVLVVASEILSRVIRLEPEFKDTAILFGDGAGACVVSRDSGIAGIADSILASDGAQADALQLPFGQSIVMDGRSIIMQVSRKLPRVIGEVLERNHVAAADVEVFLLHQANRNLFSRVAKTLNFPEERIYCNLDRFGNTSSASMLIAAAEWYGQGRTISKPVVFGAFGAGLNWGAVLCTPMGG